VRDGRVANQPVSTGLPVGLYAFTPTEFDLKTVVAVCIGEHHAI
jgi:hypothetical protein